WLAMAEVPPASFLTMEAAFLTRLARLGTKLHIRPLEVRLPQHLPGADIESFLGVRPVHGDIFTFVISAEDAQRPFATANDTMWHILEPALERRLDELAREASMTERVRTVLAELLPIRRGTAEEVSARVGTGVRTLQRRLRDEGQSFQEILSATRLQLARNYLQTTSLSCSEISGLLGYQNPSSFSRAFQSWTGVSPEKARSTSEVMRRAG
ncbi:MAG: helix-turn-helix transcriptional regulator, partial [Myxococcota bacterium]